MSCVWSNKPNNYDRFAMDLAQYSLCAEPWTMVFVDELHTHYIPIVFKFATMDRSMRCQKCMRCLVPLFEEVCVTLPIIEWHLCIVRWKMYCQTRLAPRIHIYSMQTHILLRCRWMFARHLAWFLHIAVVWISRIYANFSPSSRHFWRRSEQQRSFARSRKPIMISYLFSF